MSVKQIIPVSGKWHVVVRDRESGEGSLFLRVACWALVEGKKGNEVLPLVYDHAERGGELRVYSPASDVVGIAAPGEGHRASLKFTGPRCRRAANGLRLS
jgi:hypothetical protein